MKDGYYNRCKECTKNISKIKQDLINSSPVLKEKDKARHREKYYRLYQGLKKDPIKQSVYQAQYRKNYPEKYSAKNRTQHLKKQPGNELHHWSYNEEHYKDVIELSIENHNFIHRFIVYDQEFYMYRDKKNNLLDTRELHIEYLRSLGIEV